MVPQCEICGSFLGKAVKYQCSLPTLGEFQSCKNCAKDTQKEGGKYHLLKTTDPLTLPNKKKFKNKKSSITKRTGYFFFLLFFLYYLFIFGEECQSIGFVIPGKLNVRESHSENSSKIGTYDKNEKVCVMEQKGNWLRAGEGWISSKFVKIIQ